MLIAVMVFRYTNIKTLSFVIFQNSGFVAAGTTGAHCETDATDDCATAPCKNGGMCVNQLYNYRCLCTSGYSGTT